MSALRPVLTALVLLALAPLLHAAAVTLEWDAPDACAGCLTPDGYALFRQAGSALPHELGQTGASTLTYTDTPSAPGTYTYHVRSLYLGAYSDGSNEVRVTLPAAPPALFQVTPQPGRLLLTWHGFDRTRPVVLERKRATTSFFVLAEVLSNAFDDRGLPRGTRYCYRAKYAGDTLYAPDVCAVVE